MPVGKSPLGARRASLACVLIGILALAPNKADATPLNLAETHPGDVTTHYTFVQYSLDANPNTGTLTAVGYPDQFDVHNQNILFDGNNSFSLTATINRSTGALVSGTVSISGDTDGSPSYSGLLLQGTLSQFGFPDLGPNFGGGNIFEFVVHVTSGALLTPYYGSQTAGIIMNIANGSSSPSFTGAFTTPFKNNGDSGVGGSSDTFSMTNPNVPEPSSLALLGLGCIPLAWRLRRRGRRLF
jgi:hypothetical protein